MLIMNMVLGIDDLDPKLQIRANFIPTWKCDPIFMKFGLTNEHAKYEHNTHYGLVRSRDYWLRMILDRKIRLTFRA